MLARPFSILGVERGGRAKVDAKVHPYVDHAHPSAHAIRPGCLRPLPLWPAPCARQPRPARWKTSKRRGV